MDRQQVTDGSVYRKQAGMAQEQTDSNEEQPTDTGAEQTTPSETEDEPVAVDAATRTLAGRLRSLWPKRRSTSADDESESTEADADADTPLDTDEDGLVPTFGSSKTRTATEDEPVATPRTLTSRLRSLWPMRRSKAAASSSTDDETSSTLEGAATGTPLDTDEDGLVPTFGSPEAPTSTEDEPVAVEAALPEASPEAAEEAPEVEAGAVEAPLPVVPIEVPDSPFPIEAAIAAKARAQQGQDATLNERPDLRIVSTSDADGDLPAFLIKQMRHRQVVGGRMIDQQEPKEKSVA